MTITIEELPHCREISPRQSVRFTEILFSWIEKRYSERRNGAKALATIASFGECQVSHRTTEAWIRRERAPSPQSVEIMAARCPDLCAALEQERRRLRELLRPNI